MPLLHLLTPPPPFTPHPTRALDQAAGVCRQRLSVGTLPTLTPGVPRPTAGGRRAEGEGEWEGAVNSTRESEEEEEEGEVVWAHFSCYKPHSSPLLHTLQHGLAGHESKKALPHRAMQCITHVVGCSTALITLCVLRLALGKKTQDSLRWVHLKVI